MAQPTPGPTVLSVWGFFIRGIQFWKFYYTKSLKYICMNMLWRFYIHSYIKCTYRCFYLICICMPILYMPIHYMQGVGVGWGGKGQKAIYYICISFWGLYTIQGIYSYSIHAFEGCMHICSVVRKWAPCQEFDWQVHCSLLRVVYFSPVVQKFQVLRNWCRTATLHTTYVYLFNIFRVCIDMYLKFFVYFRVFSCIFVYFVVS